MLRARGLRPTPATVAVLAGVALTPWAAAEAVHWGLEREDRRREVHLDEVRQALATLGPDRILDESPRSARAGVAALLDADRPLSQTELADRAGISAQSWRNHRDALIAADWVRETPDGWRVSLPFRSERDDAPAVADPPWWSTDAAQHASDVLTWFHYDREGIAGDPLDPDDALGHALEVSEHGLPRAATDPDAARAALEGSSVPPDLVLSRCGSSSRRTTTTATVAMGRSTTQTSLV